MTKKIGGRRYQLISHQRLAAETRFLREAIQKLSIPQPIRRSTPAKKPK